MTDKENIPFELYEAVLAEMCEKCPSVTLWLLQEFFEAASKMASEDGDLRLARDFADPEKMTAEWSERTPEFKAEFTATLIAAAAGRAAARTADWIPRNPEWFDIIRKALVDAREEEWEEEDD